MSTSCNRIVYIDIIKGIAIILVIMGHVLSDPSLLRNAIYTFHMPLFFIISGYFLKFKSENAFRKNFRSLLVPYLAVGGDFYV